MLSGLALMWWVYDFQMGGSTGMTVLGIGAVAGIVGMLMGPVVGRIAARDKDPASPAARRAWGIFAGLTGLAALCMATFRYF